MKQSRLVLVDGQWYTKAALREIKRWGRRACVQRRYFKHLKDNDPLDYIEFDRWCIR